MSSDEEVANEDDLSFINDDLLEEESTDPYAVNYCQNVIDVMPDGEEIMCHDLCSPAEQYCKLCRSLMRLI